MPVEDVRVRLRRKLEEAFGAEEASILMDRPPGGWTDLVTNQTLDLKIDALRAELRGEMAELRGEMAELRTGLRLEMAELSAGLRQEMAELSASVDRRLRNQTIVMTTTLIAGITLSATLSHV
jgi:hypothetical protein